MKKIIIFLIITVSITLSSSAKKDINAWKNEENLTQQFDVFKKNLNFWNGSYFLTEIQLNEFYNALTDSIKVLEDRITGEKNLVSSLQNELDSTNTQLENTKVELASSIRNQNAIEIFGQYIHKNTYTFFMTMFIVILLIILGILFMLYKRSHQVTSRTKKDYDELKEEFETHKKNALERYTKINMELHHTRLELKKK